MDGKELGHAIIQCHVRLADKPWLKVLLANLLGEKNSIRWLAYKQSEQSAPRSVSTVLLQLSSWSRKSCTKAV